MTTNLEADFAARVDPLRSELLAHCYRMLGSVHDAEDLLQETLLRAWRAFGRYDEGRASLRTWLYRIATNACLTALEQRSRRPLPSGIGAPGDDPAEPLVPGEVPWLQPFPDTLAGDPAGAALARGSLRLALAAALQLLPARQRAVFILREVLDWPAAEVAQALDTSAVAVNSALQRARATLGAADLGEDQLTEPDDPVRRQYVERYVTAFEHADIDALTSLLTADAVLEMPPFINWYRGRAAYGGFISRVWRQHGTDWRMIPAGGANGQPVVVAYLRGQDGRHHIHTLQVLAVTPAGISRNTTYPDSATFALFGLASELPG
ncbi:MAG TPA: sigma-70 family RNA polymerase sigma factor [Streptosporangiaceae bacterium]|nr:sigma-70 family RNA polymerase sigma factor [Streptosporangiaceae bacterium]